MSIKNLILNSCNTNKFKIPLDDYLSGSFLESLKSGRIFIRQNVLYPFLETSINEEDDVSMTHAEFTSDHILLNLSVRKLGSQFDCPLKLTIISFEINKHKQQIVFEPQCDKPIGHNLLGRIAVAIASGLISRILKEKISNIGQSTSHTSEEGSYVCVDLSEIEQIKILLNPIPVIKLCSLDFFTLTGIEHAEDGLLLFVENKFKRGNS